MNKQNEKTQKGGGITSTITTIIYIVCMIIAAILSWRVNSNEYMVMKFIYAIASFISGPIYLIYYMIIRVWLGYEYNFISKISTSDIYITPPLPPRPQIPTRTMMR